MTFSNTSKTLRKEKGLSQVQLAEALNISKACISMIEIGKNEPTANTLLKYADFSNAQRIICSAGRTTSEISPYTQKSPPRCRPIRKNLSISIKRFPLRTVRKFSNMPAISPKSPARLLPAARHKTEKWLFPFWK